MPDLWMDVDAGLAEVPVNIMSLLDDTDFKSREVSIAYDAAGMDLVWNFITTAGAFTQTAVTPTTGGDYDWAHQGDGMYSIEIPASGGASINNDAEGFGWFTGLVTGVLPWRGPVIGFRAAALNNALIDGGDNLDVNVAQWLAQAVTLSSNNNPDVNIDEISDDLAAAQNLESAADNYSATRGLAGTALPAAAADAAGGLPISDDGGLDMDALDSKLDRNAALGESRRGYHTWSGNVFYVDPVNGDTHGNGNRGGKADPYKTIQDCHDNAVTDSNHDVIILVPGAAAGVTTHTVAATTTISKRYTFIRGPGRDFIITRTGSGDTIAITADGVEISGVQIGTAATGSGDGIDITDADFVRIHHCWFLDTRGDGIHVLRGENCRFYDNHFDGTGVAGSGQGIHISGTAGSSNDNFIYDNHFAETAGDSIRIENGTTNDTVIRNNEIHNSSAWGVNIGASSTDAQIHSNIFSQNASGDITDAGTTTTQKNNEQWAKNALLPAALVGGRIDASVGAMAADVLTASALATDAAQEIADEVLKRGVSNVEGAADTTSLAAVILAILESSVSGTTWTIRKTGGTTFVTKTLTVDAAADPITGVT